MYMLFNIKSFANEKRNGATKHLICTTVFVEAWENIKIWEGGLKVKSLKCVSVCVFAYLQSVFD